MNIIEAIQDPKLFKPYLGDDLVSWEPWCAALSAVYGLRVRKNMRELVQQCTGRDARSLPKEGFDISIFLTGRRSGKSRIAAIIGAYEAVIASRHVKLAKGERGVVSICAPSRRQSKIVKEYLRAVFDSPVLRQEVVRENQDGFDLRNGISIQILTGDFRTIRGFTVVAAIVDEACFFGVEESSHTRSDKELVRAISPALATTNGKLVLISSPYAKRGYCYEQFKRSRSKAGSPYLVWNCPSRTMNPNLPQRVVDKALRDDPISARAEYFGEFRDDIAEYLPLSVLEPLVVPGRKSLLPARRFSYYGFADLSGGRSDDAALAIAHPQEDSVVLDLVARYKAPFSPIDVIRDMCERLEEYRCRWVMGDNYAAEFVRAGFKANGLKYRRCKLPKSKLYLEMIPWIGSARLALLDDPLILKQISSLERKVRAGGNDIVDHPTGQHDDLANVVAGVIHVCNLKKFRTTRSL